MESAGKGFAALRKLAGPVGQAVSVDAGDKPFSDAQLRGMSKLLTDVHDDLLLELPRIITLLEDGPACTTLSSLTAVAIRYSNVSALAEDVPNRKFIHAVLRILHTALASVSSVSNSYRHLCLPASVRMAQFSTTLFRMQILQCASQRLSETVAYMREALVAAATPRTPPLDPHPTPAAPTSAAATMAPAEATTAASVSAIHYTFTLVETLCLLIRPLPALHSDSTPGRRFTSELAAALHDSSFLEHASQAMITALLLLKVPVVEAAADARGTKPRLFHEVLIGLHSVANSFSRLQELQLRASLAGASYAEPLEEVLTGRCLQNFVLCWGIVLLAGADSGTVYGMEPCLRRHLPLISLPPDRWGVPDELNEACRLPVIYPSALREMLAALKLYDSPGSPLPGWQAATGVALRVASLALASAAAWVELEEEGLAAPGQGAASAAAGGQMPAAVEGQPWRRPLDGWLPRDCVVEVGCAALWTAMSIQTNRAPGAAAVGGAAAGRRGAGFAAFTAELRWRMTMFLVEYALRWRAEQGFDGVVVLMMPQGAVPIFTGPRLSPSPSLEVAAALRAGLLPCLERLLRCAGRAPTSSEALLVVKVLEADPGFFLGQLLLYGDPRASAATFATLRKLRRRHFASGHAQDTTGAAQALLQLKSALLQMVRMALTQGLGWLIHAAAGAAADGAAAGANADAGGGGGGGLERHLGWVLTQFLHDWLLAAVQEVAMPYGLLALKAAIDDDPYMEAFVWPCLSSLQLLTYSLEHDCLDAPAPVQVSSTGGTGAAVAAAAEEGPRGGGADAWPVAAIHDGGEGGAAGHPRTAAADRWQARVLLDANVILFLGIALRLFEDERGQGLLQGPGDPPKRLCLADVLCRVAVAFPGKVREAVVAGAAAYSSAEAQAAAAGRAGGPRGATAAGGGGGRGPAGRRGDGRRRGDGVAIAAAAAGVGGDVPLLAELVTTVSFWPPALVRSLAERLRMDDLHRQRDAAVAALEALAAQLELWVAGGGSSGEDSAAAAGAGAGPLSGVYLPANSAAQMAAALLAAPADLRGPAPLRFCANPGCANLEGDSEAALRLAACGRCGAVGYCSKECQRAHWAAGHKAECAGRSRGPPAAGIACLRIER